MSGRTAAFAVALLCCCCCLQLAAGTGPGWGHPLRSVESGRSGARRLGAGGADRGSQQQQQLRQLLRVEESAEDEIAEDRVRSIGLNVGPSDPGALRWAPVFPGDEDKVVAASAELKTVVARELANPVAPPAGPPTGPETPCCLLRRRQADKPYNDNNPGRCPDQYAMEIWALVGGKDDSAAGKLRGAKAFAEEAKSLFWDPVQHIAPLPRSLDRVPGEGGCGEAARAEGRQAGWSHFTLTRSSTAPAAAAAWCCHPTPKILPGGGPRMHAPSSHTNLTSPPPRPHPPQ